jgi:hypothetical protein
MLYKVKMYIVLQFKYLVTEIHKQHDMIQAIITTYKVWKGQWNDSTDK